VDCPDIVENVSAINLFRIWVPANVPNTGSGRIEFPLTDAALSVRSAWDPANDPSPMGYSVGRWDGDTLIVETSHISYPYFDDLGTPQSDSMRVTETFDLDAESGLLSWTAEIVDPASFTETVVLEISWLWIPGNERKSFNCALPVSD